MGLDMSLSRKNYVKNWEHTPDENKHEIIIKQNGVIREDIKPERICYIVEEVGYWRKFNALHNWFVINCQDGEDNCGEYYVSDNDMKELLKLLSEVQSHKPVNGELVSSESAEQLNKIFPTVKGFFFGGTHYDEYYFEQVEETIKIITECLEDKEGSYYYSSSW